MKIGIRVKAGPGHNPPIPQPIPKIKAPQHNFQSIVLLFGTSNFSAKIGFYLTFIM